jgi:hypothetical protein
MYIPFTHTLASRYTNVYIDVPYMYIVPNVFIYICVYAET